MKISYFSYLKEIKEYYGRNIDSIFLFKMLSVIISAFCVQYVPAFFLQKYVDNPLIGIGENYLTKVVFVMCILFAIDIFAPAFFDFLFSKKRISMFIKTQSDIFKRVLIKPIKWFDAVSTGEVLSGFNNDCECMGIILGEVIPQICFRLGYGIGAILVVFLLDYRFGIIILLSGGLILMTRKNLMNGILNLTEKKLDFIKTVDGFVTEIFSSKSLFFDLPIFEQVCNEYIEKNNKLMDCERKLIKQRGKMQSIIQTISEAIIFCIWIVFIYIDNKCGNGEVETNLAVLPMLKSALNFFNLILVTYWDVLEGLVGGKNVFEKFSLNESFPVMKNKNTPLGFLIKCENVSFAYGEECVIENFTIEIEEGELIEIRGEKGSGKTTLVKLLMGLYNDYQGKISIGGYDIKTIDVNNLFSYVPTNVYHFKETIGYNLFFKNEYSEEEYKKVEDALFCMDIKYDSIDEFLMRKVDELSSGERNRIAFARALLKNAPILILDEYNANIDTKTESIIFDRVKKYFTKKTIIFVNHKEEYSCTRKIVCTGKRING